MAKLNALSEFLYEEKKKLPTGIDPLDTILNNGPEQGDLIALASKQGGGKSTMLLQLSKIFIEQHQLKVAYIDVERGVKKEILDNMSLTEHLESGDFFLTNRVSTYQDASKIIDAILESGENYGLLVIDSITQLVPTKMLDGDVEGQEMALKARAMTRFIDKYRGALANANIVTFFVVQYRKNMNQSYPGAAEYNTAAPMALNHACDVVMHIKTSNSKERSIYEKADTATGTTEVKRGLVHYLYAEKNKHEVPNIMCDFPVIYGQEISNFEYLKRLVKHKGLIKRGGPWITEVAGTPVKLQGEAALQEYLEDNFWELREKLFKEGYYKLVNLVGVLDAEASLDKATDSVPNPAEV